MLHHAARCLQLGRSLGRILDRRFEEQVDNVVAVVSDGGLVAVHLGAGGDVAKAQLGLAALERRQRRNRVHRVLVAEGHDLNGQREAGAEAVAQLRLVDDDDELLGALLDDLFTEERAAATLYQVERWIHRIGAVDGHIELGEATLRSAERGQRDTERLALLLGAHRGGDGDDILQLARLEQLAHALHSERSRRASAKANHHARPDVVINSLVAHHLFELILGERRCRRAHAGRDCAPGGQHAVRREAEHEHVSEHLRLRFARSTILARSRSRSFAHVQVTHPPVPWSHTVDGAPRLRTGKRKRSEAEACSSLLARRNLRAVRRRLAQTSLCQMR